MTAYQPDILVVGAGPVGCIVAERFASQAGLSVHIVEKRDHIAGNCFDCYHPSGVLIHPYGPHYFRTNSRDLVNYLAQFTAWKAAYYQVQCLVEGTLYPFPICRETLARFFKCKLETEAEAESFVKRLQMPIHEPKNSEEFVCSRVGKQLFEAFYEGYTRKQWGIEARALRAEVCGRIPIRFNNDQRYVTESFQMLPDPGYTALFKKMIDQPGIRVSLNCSFDKVRTRIRPRIATIYTGCLDLYFNEVYGALPWRSLKFDFQHHQENFHQPVLQINYPNDYSYTRSVEIKHITQQKIGETVVSYETPFDGGEPFYPIPSLAADRKFAQYNALADQEAQKNSVYFAGRLARFSYINMDQAMMDALKLFALIRRKHGITPTKSYHIPKRKAESWRTQRTPIS